MNPFKNASGRFLIRQLFFENELSDKRQCMYTLKKHDHMGYPSLYRLFMECDDPSEYSFAVQHLGGWGHWKELNESPHLKDIFQEWREELDVRTRAKALNNIREIAEQPSPVRLAANKLLLDGGWKRQEKEKEKAGRPSKERIRQEADRLLEYDKDILEDARRLNS